MKEPTASQLMTHVWLERNSTVTQTHTRRDVWFHQKYSDEICVNLGPQRRQVGADKHKSRGRCRADDSPNAPLCFRVRVAAQHLWKHLSAEQFIRGPPRQHLCHGEAVENITRLTRATLVFPVCQYTNIFSCVPIFLAFEWAPSHFTLGFISSSADRHRFK